MLAALFTFAGCAAETETAAAPVSDCFGDCCPSSAPDDVTTCGELAAALTWGEAFTYRCGMEASALQKRYSICGPPLPSMVGHEIPEGKGELVCCSYE
jgi:hypothetical protein